MLTLGSTLERISHAVFSKFMVYSVQYIQILYILYSYGKRYVHKCWPKKSWEPGWKSHDAKEQMSIIRVPPPPKVSFKANVEHVEVWKLHGNWCVFSTLFFLVLLVDSVCLNLKIYMFCSGLFLYLLLITTLFMVVCLIPFLKTLILRFYQ